MSRFSQVEMAPPDSILGLTEAFKKETNPNKINLSVGVYKDEKGTTPILATVKAAEKQLLENEKTKSYLSIEGSKEYGDAVQELLFGAGHAILTGHRAVTAHTPGGTGGLRVGADFIKGAFPSATVWMSDPTWPNHPNVFEAAGLAVKKYPYFDAAGNCLKEEAMLAALAGVAEGDVVLVHGCCHNPTGIDPTIEQWASISKVIAERGAIPFVDFAYQGFAESIEADAAGLRLLCEKNPDLLIASSFSKNFGLYNERVGALTVVGADSDAAERALSQVKARVRANYSNPPSHGAAIVSTILRDAGLRTDWEREVQEMRERIHAMRSLFVETLKAKGVQKDFSFLQDQRGMFSFSGLTPDHVERLKKEFGIYIVGSGRINVAGMTRANMDALCEAVAKVLG